MKSIFSVLFLCGLMGVLAACSSIPTSQPALSPESTSTKIVSSPTHTLTQTQTPPSPTVTIHPPTEIPTTVPPTEIPITVPLTETSLPDCVTLIYGEYAQFEIVGSSGQRVLVDVFNPPKLSSQVTESDVLLTTHTHWDHWNEEFQVKFPGLQLFAQTGFLEAPGIIIHGIASAHNEGDRFKLEGGTNYIYLIEIGSLRIAHFGDIGQKALTDEQLAVLETIDIAITQINNNYSDMNAQNRKGINLVEQLQPRLVIPTHLNLDTIKLAVTQWDGYYTESPTVRICESDLKHKGTRILLMGDSVGTMIKYVNLVEWGSP
jgi:hypothetical protein